MLIDHHLLMARMVSGFRPMESDGPWSANLVLELWLRKNSEPRFKLLEKAYLERHRGGRNKLYKEWAQETSHRGKEEPLELRRKVPNVLGVRKAWQASWEREPHWVLRREGIYLEASGEDLDRIFIRFPGMPCQGHGLH